jgi:hypothetical protein
LIADEVHPLPERRDIGRVLTAAQKAILLRTASLRPNPRTNHLYFGSGKRITDKDSKTSFLGGSSAVG